ncbi:TIM-barrel domain-containing protein [Paenibacillus sp. GXUN7292]|uniref:TIM-barrel domain-containing protein n=1 Tax=Paenibacillus sp. GXUN7292 TaxID=3422499 RepID=UPI003D7ECCC9
MRVRMRVVSCFVLLAMMVQMGMLPASPVKAFAAALGNIINVDTAPDTLTLTIDNGPEPGDDILEIKAAEQNILKFNYRPNGVASSASTPIIDPDVTWSSVGAAIDSTGDPIVVTTSDLRLEITRTPARLTLKKSDGTTLLWEPSSGGMFHDGVRFQHDQNHNMYGIRSFDAMEDVGGILRSDNQHPAHAGQQGDAGGPFIWSTAGYGLLVDSDGGYPYTESATGKLEFYYGGTPVEGRRYAKSNVEFYLMVGDPYNIMQAYSKITGAAPMMPKWSLGLSNFEWGINESELKQSVDRYRASNIPLDAYALDYDWKKYGESNYGEFQWNTTNFPSAATTALKNEMDSKGMKLIGITKPRIVTKDFGGARTLQYYDAEAGGYWYPGHGEYTDYFIPVTVRSVDPYQAAVRSWLWNSSIDAYNKGIVGWWNDETDKVSSGAAQYWFGNYSTLHWSQAMYEGQRQYTNGDERVWQTGRTYYPGTQRYATSLWSGDIGSQFYKGELFSWATGMKEQAPIMLSAINMGQAKWGMDAGGFNQPDGTISNPMPELYARWMQFAAMTPVARLHGNYNQQRQPWYYGQTAEEVSKSAIQLRYSLLPYMYSYERQAYEQGAGLVRPLIFDYPGDPNAANITDSWMFGDYLLVSPVLDKGQKSKSIYLPPGLWTDYFRGNTYTGGQVITYSLNDRTWTDMPIFIKQGAIIPSQEVLNYVDQKAVDTVQVDIFPAAERTSFTYYDDDGQSYQYESGSFFKQLITAQDQGSAGYNLQVHGKDGSFNADVSQYILKLHNKSAETVKHNGANLTEYASLTQLEASSSNGWSKGRDIYGPVTYVKIAAGLAALSDIQAIGSSTVVQHSIRYEGEQGSLTGASLAAMATVSSGHSGYSGTGFVEGLHHNNAAVTFYADVASAGDYDIDLRYANATGSSKSLSIFVNGERIKSTDLPNMASWSTWGNKQERLPLEAGRNIITYRYFDEANDSGNVNIDYIEVPFTPVQYKVELERGKLAGGAALNDNHWFYSGTAFVDNMLTAGAKVEFTVDVGEAGVYSTSLRYANGSGSNKSISTYVNGIKIRQNILSSSGNNWNVWMEAAQSLTLQAGLNTIAFAYDSSDSGNVNLDRFVLSKSAIAQPQSELNLLDNGDFERSQSSSSNWTEWHPAGNATAYGIDSGNGMNPPESARTGSKRAYFHAPGAYKQSIHQLVDVPVNNSHYKFEAWVRLSGNGATTARAEVDQYGGSRLDYNIPHHAKWRFISIDNIYVTSGVIDVGFYVDSPGGTVLQIDNVRVIKQ